MIALFTNRWGVAAMAVVLLAGVLTIQTARLNAARRSEMASVQIASQWRTNFEAMEATNSANVRAIEKLQAEAKRIETEAKTARKINARLATEYDTLRKSIHHADEERALSPVLCRTFDELRRLQHQPGTACRN